MNGLTQICVSESSSRLCLSVEEIRTKILEEIVNTEQEYVHSLEDIVEVMVCVKT